MREQDIERLMEEYRNNVRALFEKKSSDFANNSSSRHASILIEEMVLHARRSFVAFAGRMNPIVWNERVMAALADAVNRGVQLRLIVESECEPINNGTMPVSVRSFVRKVQPQMLDHVKAAAPHCACGDEESLRVETDPSQKSAIFAANNPEVAARVVGIVDGLYNMGVPYDGAA